ncbi:hypothetical protein LBYZC6_15240 [Lacrimispora brassicae]
MNKRLLSMFLALCMIVTMLPVSAMAEEIHTTIGGSGEITNFAPLTETEKTRALGTSIQDLELPETLTATVRTAVPADENPVQDSGNPGTATPATTTEPQWEETTVEIPVTWVSPGYDRNTEGEYFFTPVVESYTVSAPLPEIVVTVGEMPPIAARGLVTPMFTTTYDIWVGGVQVTSENKEDVLGDTDGDGATVTYNSDTNTLTLNDAAITTGYTLSAANYGIYAPNGLKLKLVGANSIALPNSLNTIYGICTQDSDLQISAENNGSLTVTGSTNFGIYSENLTINSGAITTVGSVIFVGESVSISGGTVTSTGGTQGIVGGTITVSGGTITASGSVKALTNSVGSPDFTGMQVTASANMNGTPAVSYNAANLSTYKYIKVEPGAAGTTAPTVTSVTVPGNGTYSAGNNLDFTVTFDENVTVNTSSGTPYLSLIIGSTSRQATYVSGSGASNLVFRYTVQAGDSDSNGISIGSLILNGGTIQDGAGNNANLTLNSVGNMTGVLVDTSVAPSITGQPYPQTVNEGQSVNFLVTATGTGLTYQWQVNTGSSFANISSGGVYSGASTSTLTITGVTAGMNGYQYRAIVSGTVAPVATSNSATLTVTAAPSYTITANPTAKDFGSLTVGYTAPAAQTVTITNTGNSSVALTQPTSTSYTIGALSTTTLAAGGTATFTVAPKVGLAVGNYNETLTVSTNHSTNATVNLSFSVTAVPTYTITANPTSKDFGSLEVGYSAPTAQTVTITNTGNSSLTLTQPTSTNYTIGTLSTTTLAAGDIATFTITPKAGLAVGNYNETLNVSTNHSTNATVGLSVSVTAVSTYTISGTIKGSDTGSGINGASVWLKNGSGPVGTPVLTDANGAYTISNVSAGSYSIDAGAPGYYLGTISSVTVSANVTGKDLTLTSIMIFTPVTDITMTNAASVQAGSGLTLTGIVSPANATNQSIVWSVENANGTGATIAGSTFSATSAGTATVKATVANGSTASSDYTKTFDITVTTIPVVTHTITATAGTGGSISPSGSVTVDSGTSKAFTITPSSNYSIADVKVDDVSQGKITSYTFSGVSANHTIAATFSYNGSSGGDGGGSSSDNSSPVIVTPPAPDKPNSPTQGEIKVPGTADGKGNVIVNITGKTVTDAFDKALAEAKKNGTEQNGITVVLRVDTGNKTGSNVTVNLPKTVQDTIIEKKIVNTIVVVDNPDIRIGMDLATVQEINKQAKSDVNITATRGDSSKLTGDAKKAIGSRPVFDLNVNYGNGKAVSSFGAGSVSVTIPYTLGANENAGNVQAVYVDAKGKVHWLTNSVYDSVEQVLRFSTDHFSTYGIGYKQTNTAFTDIAAHWAKEDIEFVVSRGLFSGTSETKFSPNAAMTRGMFVTVLGRLASADVSGYAKSSFSDVKSDAYYMGYIEWASKNNIVNGVGNGRFAPDQSITREQMAVIMSNYAKTIGYTLPKVHVENTFADNGKISAYAKEAVKQMQMAGVISGKNGNLFDPQGTATRAEVSAVLRRFVELAISNDTAQGWTMNDSGKWMYFKDGKPLTGKQDIDGGAYTFDQYGVTADVPKNLRYTTYIVQKGDSFWLIAHKLGCTMSELERLNNKSRFSIIYPGDVLRVPEK